MAHGDMQGDPASRVLEVEVRNLKIGEDKNGNVFGYQLITRGTSVQQRINSVSHQLRDMGITLCTMGEYKEMLMALKDSGNQEDDDAESLTEGRKSMVWGIPRNITPTMFEDLCRKFLGPCLESFKVTISRKNFPYAWLVVDQPTKDRIDRLAALEIQMQKVWGPEVYMALSRTRQQRIRYFDQLRSRKEAAQQMQSAKASPPGTLRVIDFPKEVMQSAMLEEAFMGHLVDSMCHRMIPLVVAGVTEGLLKALEPRIEQIISSRLDLMLARMETALLRTVDSSIDCSLFTALEHLSLEVIPMRPAREEAADPALHRSAGRYQHQEQRTDTGQQRQEDQQEGAAQLAAAAKKYRADQDSLDRALKKQDDKILERKLQ